MQKILRDYSDIENGLKNKSVRFLCFCPLFVFVFFGGGGELLALGNLLLADNLRKTVVCVHCFEFGELKDFVVKTF